VSNFYLDLAVTYWFSLALLLLDCCLVDEETSERRDRGTINKNLQGRNPVLGHKINNKGSCTKKPNFCYKTILAYKNK
jgi:hypothetical protein